MSFEEASRVFLDPQLFSRINDFADELLKGEWSGKYSPIEVAQWIEDYAGEASRRLAEGAAKATGKERPEYRRMAIDIELQAALGRFFGGFDHLDIIAFTVKDGLEGKAHVPFVVHDKNGREWEAHGFNFIRMRDGNCRVKRVPLPGSDSTLTAPPYISVLCLTIARPRPVPLARVVK